MEINETDNSSDEIKTKNPLFTGGSKFGNMTAFYYQNGEHPIQFELFELCDGKVFGHGDDVVGTFNVEGTYSIENCVIKMEKKYVGQHTVYYEGTILLKTNFYELEGMWNINGEISGKFSMVLYHNQTNFNKTAESIEQNQSSLIDAEKDSVYSSTIDITGKAVGYYIENGEKFDMTFDILALSKGCITGRGSDSIGSFLIDGTYHNTELLANAEVRFAFKKHYEGMHDVFYSGVVIQIDNTVYLDGNWMIGELSDSFHIEIFRIYKCKRSLLPK
ncbi:uncharacterized protein LOC100202799 isoform X1 [Hydra vulgaris]|uniref:Uncharacterized protein LOC100202799 isoform X1 n=1 Tax=Hydra vulgaris TaxID=6087 RepID=A0ABM4BRU9_HYDVU